MRWNWQQDNWPEWVYDADALAQKEQQFLLQAGQLIGAWKYLGNEDRITATIDIITSEAMQTSEIEGEYLDQASVESSVRRAFGLSAERRRGVAESGIADLLTHGFTTWHASLDVATLHSWHTMVCRGRGDLQNLGAWRQGSDPMQVVSGPMHRPRIHFEAPRSDQVPAAMERFIRWYNQSSPGGKHPMAPLARAGLAHVYFVTIHPFEDGNGRIARALSEKVLAQSIGHPSLAGLSACINKARKAYYGQLGATNRTLDVTAWLDWFGGIILKAQLDSIDLVDHIVFKSGLLERLQGQLNARQSKALIRMLDTGPVGFEGGMSNANYMTITGASPATARRDLGGLVALKALTRTGERKSTRYWLRKPTGAPMIGTMPRQDRSEPNPT